MNKGIRIKIIPALWYLFVCIISYDSIVRYHGSTWESTEYGNVMQSSGNTSYSVILFELIILFILFFSLVKHGRIRASLMSKCALVLMIVGVIWTMWTLTTTNYGTSIIQYNTSPVLLIEIAIIMIAVQQEEISAIIKKTTPFLACFYTILAFTEAISFRTQFSVMRMAGGPVISYFAYALFLVWTWSVYIRNTKREMVILYSCSAILAVTSMIITSRGWIIQAVILMIVLYMTKSNKKTGIKIRQALIMLIILASVYLVIKYRFSDSVSYILSRFAQDTRSTQYEAFFTQVPLFNLITGKGMNATYFLNGGAYGFIDNQFLFWMFRYGLLSVFAYWIPFIYGLVKKSPRSTNKIQFEHYAALIMYILAMGGLSIYYGIFLDIGTISCLLLASEMIKRKRNTKSTDKGEELYDTVK